MAQANMGLIGVGTMGSALALNIAEMAMMLACGTWTLQRWIT